MSGEVYNLAHKLAKAIKRSEEYKAFERVKKEIEKEQEVEENIEDEIEQEENEEVDYSYLFEGQWMSQVKNVKEFTDDIEKLEEILEYAKENDVTDAVIERVEDYIYELEG